MELFAHQKQSIDKFRSLTRTFDASDPGTGKTRVILELIREREQRALVICPKTLMETAWVDDAAKFTPELVVLPIYAGPKREQMVKFDADILVFNTDAVKWLVDQPKAFFDRFDVVVLDESSAFKHRTSKRSKAAAKVVKHFEFRHAMTGTPNSNRITDIWHQVRLIDDGISLGTAFTKFQADTCIPKQVGPSIRHIAWVDKPGAPEAVAGLIKPFTVRHKFDECIDIPPNFTRTIEFTLGRRNRKYYEQFARDALIEFRNSPVVGVNAAVAANKLLQIASGAVYSSDEDGTPLVFDTDRYDLVAELVSERDHSIVFFLWNHQKEQLEKALRKQKIDDYGVIDGSVTKGRAEIIRCFQAGMYKTLLLHPASAAHGITLTRATATIWASPTYNAEWWKQGFHRIVRAGQENQTETILVAAKDTVDKKVFEAMMAKKHNMNALLGVLLTEATE